MFTEQPTDTSVTVGHDAEFSVTAPGATAFRWYKDEQPLEDGGNIFGADTDALTISPAMFDDAGTYYCTASGACGDASSDPATLTVDPPPCYADFNQDGGIDGADVEAFFYAWEMGDSSSDVNQDGGMDGADVETFFLAWEAGDC